MATNSLSIRRYRRLQLPLAGSKYFIGTPKVRIPHNQDQCMRLSAIWVFLCGLPFVFPSASFAQNTVMLTGSISLNAQPASNRKVYFWHEQSKTEMRTETDDDGRYRVALGSGRWMISIRNWSQTAHFIAEAPETRFDWAVEGGSLEVTVSNAEGEPVTISIRRAHPDFLAIRAIPARVTSYTFEAIPFGTFEVRASSASRLSERGAVTFEPFELHKQVTLRFPQ